MKVTVTGELFQPAAFGDGLRLAVIDRRIIVHAYDFNRQRTAGLSEQLH